MPTPAAPVIGITLGDPAGVGPEVARAALAADELPGGCEFRLIGERPPAVEPGRPSRVGALAALESLEEGVRLALGGEIAALVTAPVSKAGLREVGFGYPGQTEFLAARCGVDDFAMALSGGGLSVALATIHIPLREVAGRLDQPTIVRVGRLQAEFLRRTGGRRGPRLEGAGLNPPRGESGLIGDEESRVIAPAARRLRDELRGLAEVTGPHSPDTVFHQALEGEFDGVLCMYHDQGLIPLKLHAFHSGVNVTLGLPIIRTSPDHGTAYALAGSGRARPDSMLAALRLAARLAAGGASGSARDRG